MPPHPTSRRRRGTLRNRVQELAAGPTGEVHRWHRSRRLGPVPRLCRAPRGASDSGGVEGPTAGLSQQSGEAEGSRASGGALVGWEAALTTTGRSSTARWAGPGKQGRQGATGVNRWLNPLKLWNRLESGGSGPGSSAHLPHLGGEVTPKPESVAGEATRKACGVLVARLQGHSRAPILPTESLVNVGTVPSSPSQPAQPRLVAGMVHRRPRAVGRGGGSVVVRGRESRPRGEGTQQGEQIWNWNVRRRR